MAKLGKTIVSPALSGERLEVGAKAFTQAVATQSSEVAELKGQVAALLALLQAGAVNVPTTAVSEPVVEVVPEPVAEPKAKTTKAKVDVPESE